MSKLTDKYERKNDELLGEKPMPGNYIKCWVSSEDKHLRTFYLKDYEQHLDLLPEGTEGVIRDSVLQLLQQHGMGVCAKEQPEEYDKDKKVFVERAILLLKNFKLDIIKKHKMIPKEKADEIYEVAYRLTYKGGFFIVEDSFVQIAKLLGYDAKEEYEKVSKKQKAKIKKEEKCDCDGNCGEDCKCK